MIVLGNWCRKFGSLYIYNVYRVDFLALEWE